MTTTPESRAARLLHLRAETLAKGEPVALPLTMASMYHLPGDPAGHAQYGRFSNATWEHLEEALGLLENAQAVAFPSGMAAIAAVFYSTLKAGDRILLPSDGYYTTRILAERFLAPLGVGIDTRATARFAEGGFGGYRLVFIESPSNPGLDVCDIAEVARQASAAGALTVADNTTMTPLGQQPLELGCDMVLSSDTKAMNGHSDALFGHVATRQEALVSALKDWRKLAGAIPGPFEAWLVHRGMETLEVRLDRMCRSAALIAERLQDHPAVTAIRYPGLPSDPSHAIAARQMQRHGFLIGLTLPDEERAENFINNCPLIQPATSFGGVHTSAERRARWGDAVPDGFVRLAIGCEPAEVLWQAIEDALAAAG
ncbi:MAG: cystathionine gamma-lyase [Phyllobacteriaceae bacterium]|nr:cystathionine gamma-lyase [Phyllobacteriaceae bacterium]MBA91135.1 cystathionine gamma-lyase [Phyllobacteriaceae bacterium]